MTVLNVDIDFISGDGKSTVILNLTADSEPAESIFYEFTGPAAPVSKPNGNFAAVALMPYAMHKGLDIFINAPVESELLASLEESVSAWNFWFPQRFKKISLKAAEEFRGAAPQGRSAVIALSGGLDASYALHAHKNGLPGRNTLDLQAGVLIHGFDIPLDKDLWFRAAQKQVAAIAAGYGLSLTTVRSNWRSVIDSCQLWERAFIFGVAAVMHQFAGQFSGAVIAHDCTYTSHEAGWGSNFITNPLVGGLSFPIRFTGGDQRRLDKARALSDRQVILDNLRVCWEKPDNLTNCGFCEKCVRTKLDFIAAGVDRVPALGNTLPTAEDIARLRIAKPQLLAFFKDQLNEDVWGDKPDLRKALEKAVAKGEARVRAKKRAQERIEKKKSQRRGSSKNGLKNVVSSVFSALRKKT